MEKVNAEDKLEFWRLVVEEFENSEKSIKEQCQENDIALGQYYNWRKKVRESAIDEVGTFIEVDDTEEAPIQNKPGSIILESIEIPLMSCILCAGYISLKVFTKLFLSCILILI